MGDVDRGVAIFVMQPADFEPHLLAQIGVEVGQRLVEQQRLRLDDQRARQRHALLLPAGEFAGIALRQRLELCRGQDRRRVSSRWCRGPVCAGAGRRRCSRSPSCAATARSSGRSSTCLRCSGGSVRAFDDTSRSPTWISPSDGSRKPAISRSVVVLPQPDGPEQADQLSMIDLQARRYRPPQANQIAWSGRANPRTPIASLPRLFLHGSAPGLVCQYTDKCVIGKGSCAGNRHGEASVSASQTMQSPAD